MSSASPHQPGPVVSTGIVSDRIHNQRDCAYCGQPWPCSSAYTPDGGDYITRYAPAVSERTGNQYWLHTCGHVTDWGPGPSGSCHACEATDNEWQPLYVREYLSAEEAT